MRNVPDRPGRLMRGFIIVHAEREWLVRSGERRVQSFGDRSTAICAAVLAAHASQHQEGRSQVIMVTASYEAYPVWISSIDGLSCDDEVVRLALELVSLSGGQPSAASTPDNKAA